MAKEITKDFVLRLSIKLSRQLEREVRIQKSYRTQVVREALANYLNARELDRHLSRTQNGDD